MNSSASNSKEEYSLQDYDSAYLQCFENKQNFLFSQLVPPSLTCIAYKKKDIQLLKSTEVIDRILINQTHYRPQYYKHHPLIETKQYSNTASLQYTITKACNVPLDTSYYILDFRMRS
jgi:hypothetical protein